MFLNKAGLDIRVWFTGGRYLYSRTLIFLKMEKDSPSRGIQSKAILMQ